MSPTRHETHPEVHARRRTLHRGADPSPADAEEEAAATIEAVLVVESVFPI